MKRQQDHRKPYSDLTFRVVQVRAGNATATGGTARSRRHRRAGQSLVEFALIAPLLFLVIIGTMEFGRLSFAWAAGHFAVRAASRYAVGAGGSTPHYSQCDNIEDTARRWAWFMDVDEVRIFYDRGRAESTFSECYPSAHLVTGDRVRVKMTAHFRFIVMPFSLPAWEFESGHTVIDKVPITIGGAGDNGGNGPTPTPQPTPTLIPTPMPTPTPSPTPFCVWPFCG